MVYCHTVVRGDGIDVFEGRGMRLRLRTIASRNDEVGTCRLREAAAHSLRAKTLKSLGIFKG